jgi:hypothetical protein
VPSVFNTSQSSRSERVTGVTPARHSKAVRRGRYACAALLICILAGGVIALPGCAGSTSAAKSSRPTGLISADVIANDEPRLDVVAGARVIAPISMLGPEAAAEIERRPDVRDAAFEDGRNANAELWWISADAARHPGADRAWLESPGNWQAVRIDAAARDSTRDAQVRRLRDSGPGLLAVAFRAPPDAAGQGVWFTGRRIALNWLPAPAMVAREVPAAAWQPTIPDAFRRSTSLLTLLQPEARSPLYRWRFRLLLEGLRPAAGDTTAAGAAFDDPTVEALASMIEDRWRAAFVRVYKASPAIADRLRRRLTAMINTGTEVFPAWPTDRVDLDSLVADLLNPALTPAQAARRAETWMSTQPSAVAWVIDDAAGRDALRERTLASIGLANLTFAPTLGWVGVDAAAAITDDPDADPSTPPASPDLDRPAVAPLGVDPPTHSPSQSARTPTFSPADLTREAPDPIRLAAWSIAERPALVDRRVNRLAPRRGSLSVPDVVDAHINDWSTTLRVKPGVIDAAPPGAALGPLLSQWTMREWLDSAAGGASRSTEPPEAPLRVIGLLRNTSDPAPPTRDDPAARRQGPRGWSIMLSCQIDPASAIATGDNALGDDTLRLWIGPRGRARAVFRITPPQSRPADAAAKGDADAQDAPNVGSITSEPLPTALAPEPDAPQIAAPIVGDGPANTRFAATASTWVVEIPLSPACFEPDGTLLLAIERIDPKGRRATWPRAVLPWQREPGRAALNTAAWQGRR